jgi:hypothetical protein
MLDLIWSAVSLLAFWLIGALCFSALEGWTYGWVKPGSEYGSDHQECCLRMYHHLGHYWSVPTTNNVRYIALTRRIWGLHTRDRSRQSLFCPLCSTRSTNRHLIRSPDDHRSGKFTSHGTPRPANNGLAQYLFQSNTYHHCSPKGCIPWCRLVSTARRLGQTPSKDVYACGCRI